MLITPGITLKVAEKQILYTQLSHKVSTIINFTEIFYGHFLIHHSKFIRSWETDVFALSNELKAKKWV